MARVVLDDCHILWSSCTSSRSPHFARVVGFVYRTHNSIGSDVLRHANSPFIWAVADHNHLLFLDMFAVRLQHGPHACFPGFERILGLAIQSALGIYNGGFAWTRSGFDHGHNIVLLAVEYSEWGS